MKKYLKRVSLLTMLFSIILSSFSFSAFATQNEVHTLIEKSPTPGTVVPFGTGRPPSNSTAFDVSISPTGYAYQVLSVTYQVYTDKLLTGAKQYQVSVENFRCKEGEECPSIPRDRLTVYLYDNSGTLLTQYTFNGLQEDVTSYCYFYNLNASAKYYFKFGVPDSGNIYSFNGTIKKYS